MKVTLIILIKNNLIKVHNGLYTAKELLKIIYIIK